MIGQRFLQFGVLLILLGCLVGVGKGERSGYEPTVECEACEVVLETILTLIGENATVADLLRFLEGECQNLPTEWVQTCDTVASYLDDAVLALAAFRTAREYTPYGLCCMAGGICKIECCESATSPEQIHLSLTTDPTQMVVSYVTSLDERALSPQVRYGTASSQYTMTTAGTSGTYTDGGWLGRLHTVVLGGLKPATTYYYVVGSETGGFSDEFSFRTLASAPDRLHLAVIGDMGADSESNATVALLRKHTPEFDVLLHNGDFAYADGWQMRWDVYMRKVQPVLARLPMMGNPGNHEIVYNFASYKARFVNPGNQSGSGTNMYYSYDLPFVHVVHIDTEGEYNTAAMPDDQVEWIRQDLQKANTRRASHPWVIVLGHRPLYCTGDVSGAQCGVQAGFLRGKLEQIFVDAGVNVVIGAHRHNYERTYPMANNVAPQQNYIHPRLPTYLVIGNAGNRERIDPFPPTPVPPDWSAFRLSEYGYASVQLNASHFAFQMHGDSQDLVQDSFTIVL